MSNTSHSESGSRDSKSVIRFSNFFCRTASMFPAANYCSQPYRKICFKTAFVGFEKHRFFIRKSSRRGQYNTPRLIFCRNSMEHIVLEREGNSYPSLPIAIWSPYLFRTYLEASS